MRKSFKITKKWLACLLAFLIICGMVPISVLVAQAVGNRIVVDQILAAQDGPYEENDEAYDLSTQRLLFDNYDETTGVVTFNLQYRVPHSYNADGSIPALWPDKYWVSQSLTSIYFDTSVLEPSGKTSVAYKAMGDTYPNISYASLNTRNTNITYTGGLKPRPGSENITKYTDGNGAVLSFRTAQLLDRQLAKPVNSWNDYVQIKFKLAAGKSLEDITYQTLHFAEANVPEDYELCVANYQVAEGDLSLKSYVWKLNNVQGSYYREDEGLTDDERTVAAPPLSSGIHTNPDEYTGDNYYTVYQRQYIHNVAAPIVVLSSLTIYDQDGKQLEKIQYHYGSGTVNDIVNSLKLTNQILANELNDGAKLYNADAQGQYLLNGENKIETDKTAVVSAGQNLHVRLYNDNQSPKLTVTFDANAPAETTVKNPNAVPDVILKQGATSLTDKKYEIDGYTFLGWTAEQNVDVDNTTFEEFPTAVQERLNGLTTNDETMTLYAQWKANDVDVKLSNGDLTGAVEFTDPTKYTYEDQYTLPSTNAGLKALLGDTYNNFVPQGKYLSGWSYTDKDGMAVILNKDNNLSVAIKEVHGANTAPNGTVTFTAIWAPIMYTYEYNKGEFEDGMPATSVTDMPQGATKSYDNLIDDIVTGTPTTTENYQFVGWEIQVDGQNPVAVENDTFIFELIKYAKMNDDGTAGTITITAKWAPKGTHAVTFYTTNDNGQEVVYSTQRVQDGSNLADIQKPADPTRTGYTFIGWNTDKNATVGNFPEQGIINADVKYYAIWQENSYTIKFEGGSSDGGTAMADVTLKYTQLTDDNIVPQTTTYTKTGHQFAGWSVKPGTQFKAVDTIIDPGMTYKQLLTDQNKININGSVVTLVAQWAPNRYTVKFMDDTTEYYVASVEHGNTVAGLTDPTNKPATDTTPAKKFKGWNTQANGQGTAYDPMAVVTGDATYYAQWENMYTIVFDGNGATGGTTTAHQYAVSGDLINTQLNPNGFNKQNYTFIGWSKTPGANNVEYTDKDTITQTLLNAASANGTVTLYAVWTRNPVEVTFVTVDPITGKETVLTDAQYRTVLLTETAPKIDTNLLVAPSTAFTGYTFENWYTDVNKADFAANITFTTIPETTQSITVYALWRENNYTLKLDDTTNKQLSYTQELTLSADLIPAQPGKILTGWTSEDGTVTYNLGQTISKLTDVDGATVTLLPQWKVLAADEVAVQFNANADGGAVSNMPQTITDKVTVDITLPATIPTRTGYTFGGWATDPNGNAVYQPGEVIPAGTFTGGSVINLYAKWIPNSHKVTFMVGNTQYAVHDVLEGHALGAAPATNPTAPVGYEFVGWSTDANATIGNYDPNALMGTTDVTYYAIFRAKQYTVQFFAPDANGNYVLSTEVTNQLFDQVITVPAAPTAPAGKVFVGWYTGQNGTGTLLTADMLYSAFANSDIMNISFYAYFATEGIQPGNINVTIKVDTLSELRTYPVGTTVAGVTIDAYTIPAGMKFMGWLDENGNLLPADTVLVDGMVLTAWLVKDNAAAISGNNVATGDNNTMMILSGTGMGVAALLAGVGTFLVKRKRKND